MTATLVLHYGDEKSVFGKGTAAQFAGAMLMRGTQKHTRQQLQDELDKLKAQMTANGGGQRRDRESSPRFDARSVPPRCGWRPKCCGSRRSRNLNSSSCGKLPWAAWKAA